MAIDPRLITYVSEHNRRATFEGLITDLEQICLRDLPQPDVRVVPESLPWYAKEIVDTIGVVRHWLAAGHAEIAAREAVVVGMLAARSGSPEIKKWTAQLAAASKGSKAAAQVRRENADRDAENLRAEVEGVRRKRPGLSKNGIAQALISEYGRLEEESKTEFHKKVLLAVTEDRKKALAALARRIKRCEPRRN
jgi:hypothetical protein